MFKLVDRNKDTYLVLLPGWAFDRRIFDKLDLPYNYLLADNNYITDFDSKLKEAIRSLGIGKVSIFGFSQGTFVASDFASRNSAIIEEMILIGTRKSYDKEVLHSIKKNIKTNKRAYLYKFYRDCFSASSDKSFS